MTGDGPVPSPNAHELAPGAWIEPADVVVTFVRSSGPGGQAVNKLSTKALLRVRIGAIQGISVAAASRLRRAAGHRLVRESDEILLGSDTHRSQARNRRACMDRLGQLVARAIPEPVKRKRTRPSRGSIERRLAAKRARAETKKRRGRPGED